MGEVGGGVTWRIMDMLYVQPQRMGQRCMTTEVHVIRDLICEAVLLERNRDDGLGLYVG